MSSKVGSSADGRARGEANRLGLDYRTEAALLGEPVVPIIDAHAHINGRRAAQVWAEAADLYGVDRVYSMSRLSEADAVRDTLGERVRFIAFPEWGAPDKAAIHRAGFLDAIRRWHGEYGARVCKLWAAPQLRDIVGDGADDVVGFDSPWRMRAAELAMSLGMSFMVHVGDPDIWFRTKYADAAKYGSKLFQYESFERLLRRVGVPVIAAHMGGWPENLDFLSGMLGRHPNLYLDTSATKWVVRELSAQPRDRVVAFFERWRGRILFGSDIVTMEAHLTPEKTGAASIKAEQASSAEQAFDLYASRYWALRTLFETGWEGESPIADPDLKLDDPGRYDQASAPPLRGLGVSRDLLRVLYRDAASEVLGE
ncbi:MAG TPA: hypothetical protein VFF69_07160 [Phycisphaerales bacterium]|nr:hypothetical protein [Phycisphaerales bacterium]